MVGLDWMNDARSTLWIPRPGGIEGCVACKAWHYFAGALGMNVASEGWRMHDAAARTVVVDQQPPSTSSNLRSRRTGRARSPFTDIMDDGIRLEAAMLIIVMSISFIRCQSLLCC